MLDPDPAGRPPAAAVASSLMRIASGVEAAAGDPIPDEGTVVMATAVPSRAAAAVIPPAAIEAIPPAAAPPPLTVDPVAPARAARPPAQGRAGVTGGSRLPAPALVAAGLLLLAAVALGASAFAEPTAPDSSPAPPARTVQATPAPVTAEPEQQDRNAGGGGGGGDEDKDKDKGKDDKGRGNGNGNGRGNGD
jgi:hypothetical protein